jgi:hypothetical protein
MTGRRRRPLGSRRADVDDDDDGDADGHADDAGDGAARDGPDEDDEESGFAEASDSSIERGKEKPRPRRPSGTGRTSGTGRIPGKEPPASRDESTMGFAEGDLLPKMGGPSGRGEADRAVRAIVGELREACGACAYRRICGFAPVAYQIRRSRDGEGARHAHHAVLKAGVARLEAIKGWHKALLALLAEREKDALLSGCLLATAWAKRPDKMQRLVEYTASRCNVPKLREEAAAEKPASHSEDDDHDSESPKRHDFGAIDPEKLRARMFRGQVLRALSFGRSPDDLRSIKDLLVLSSDDEGRLFQYEAVAALALLVGTKRPGAKWIGELESKALATFRATFGARDAGGSAIDIFFPYRRGKRRSYLYFRRDGQGVESIVSADKIRTDSLLYRTFRVFDSDEKKTWRVFKELCRHLNVRAGKMNADMVLAGFERLQRDDLLLLGMYAPALSRAVGHFIRVEDYHLLVKFLYKLRAESGRKGGPRVPAHEKVAQAHDEWRSLRGALGEEFVKEVFALLFRLNASYLKSSYTTDTYIKIGEVAYLLTAAAGWNPKGLELELKKPRKALALIAYGLQPPDKWSTIRVKHLARAREQVGDDADLVRAAEIGCRYMAKSHRFETFADLEEAALAGKLPETGVAVDEGSGRDLEIASEDSRRDDITAPRADDIPSGSDAGSTGIDLETPELRGASKMNSRKMNSAKTKPPPASTGRTATGPKNKGLVGQRNVRFDDDSEEKPVARGKARGGKKAPRPDDDD